MTFHSYMCVVISPHPTQSKLSSYAISGIATDVMFRELLDDYVYRATHFGWQFSSVCIDQAHYMTSEM